MTQTPKVTSTTDGPLVVTGQPPLKRKSIIKSEAGEPITKITSKEIPVEDDYALCRCGHSQNKPFCDGSHLTYNFKASDTADDSTYAERAEVLGGEPEVSYDQTICVHAGFCGNEKTSVWKQVKDTSSFETKFDLVHEVDECPSGALTFKFPQQDSPNEQDKPQQINVIDDGPLQLTGHIPVETSEGVQLENRNRVTLCRCGHSENKPLCDGKHKEINFKDS